MSLLDRQKGFKTFSFIPYKFGARESQSGLNILVSHQFNEK